MKTNRCCSNLPAVILGLAGVLALNVTGNSQEAKTPPFPESLKVPDPTSASQDDFDRFSWELFKWLNGPVGGDGNLEIGDAPEANRRWETFVDPVTIFVPKSSTAKRLVEKERVLHFLSHKEVIDLPGADEQAASKYPIIDQYGNIAVNEIRINQTEADYIHDNNLTDYQTVSKFTFNFPEKVVEIKMGWRVFPPGFKEKHPDVYKRYFTRTADIHVSGSMHSPYEPDSVIPDAELGLIGFHISTKAGGNDKWIWSTFEQIDNYEIDKKSGAPDDLTPTFNSNEIPAGSRSVNQPPTLAANGQPSKAFLWSKNFPYGSRYNPTPIQRCKNEVDLPRFKPKLPAPWKYYRLNVTQWVEKYKNGKNFHYGEVQPKNHDGVSIARNSVLETYLIGDQTLAAQIPAVAPTGKTYQTLTNSTLGDLITATIDYSSDPGKVGVYTWSSCILCHQLAAATFETKEGKFQQSVLTDSSFLWQLFPPPPGIVPPPKE